MDVQAAGTREKLESLDATIPAALQHTLTSRLDDVRRHDIVALQTPATRALMRSHAGCPHTFANAHNRDRRTTLSNPDFQTILRRFIRSKSVSPDTIGSNGPCDGCGKTGCENEYGDSRLSCNAQTAVTRHWHDPVVATVADLARFCGCRATIEPAPANPALSGRRVDVTIRGLLPNAGVIHVDVATRSVTCKSAIRTGSDIVDGAAAAAAAAGKISAHRALVLSANPDNRFLPWAVEEGGRLGADAEALVDTLIRAGCPDLASRRSAKTYWMRVFAVTTARGVARVVQRRRLPTPRFPSNADTPGRPSAASLAHLAHITTLMDRTNDAVSPAPVTHRHPLSPTSTTTSSPMQSPAAMVGA